MGNKIADEVFICLFSLLKTIIHITASVYATLITLQLMVNQEADFGIQHLMRKCIRKLKINPVAVQMITGLLYFSMIKLYSNSFMFKICNGLHAAIKLETFTRKIFRLFNFLKVLRKLDLAFFSIQEMLMLKYPTLKLKSISKESDGNKLLPNNQC